MSGIIFITILQWLTIAWSSSTQDLECGKVDDNLDYYATMCVDLGVSHQSYQVLTNKTHS